MKKESDVKVAILLNAIGEETVELFNTFMLSDSEKDNFDWVIKAFEEYANPPWNVVVERYVFNSRVQNEHESFS